MKKSYPYPMWCVDVYKDGATVVKTFPVFTEALKYSKENEEDHLAVHEKQDAD